MKIRYLYHDGFTLELGERFLIFDYYKDKPYKGTLEDGVVRVDGLEDLNVTVFVSHRHPDHYNQRIFNWRYDLKQVRYILSDDIIYDNDRAFFIGPDRKMQFEDMNLHTLKSNDEGVAFLIKMRHKTIYFAGDLNWWDWPEESSQYRDEMRESYREQLEKIQDEDIDVAFLPLDSRLGPNTVKGLDYFMRTVGAKIVIPMHFWDDYSVIDTLLEDPCSEPYRDKIIKYKRRGEVIFDDGESNASDD